VLVPTFANGHDHGRGGGNVAAGIADGPLEEWIASLKDAPRTSQEELVGDACALMLASGVGSSVICVNPQSSDTRSEVSAAAAAVLGKGARAAIVYPFADAFGDVDGRVRDEPGWSDEELARRLDDFEQVAHEYDDPCLDFQLGPVGPQWVSESTLAAIGEYALRTQRRIHMHLLESRAQRRWADATYPEGIVGFLEKIGCAGPHVAFAHGTQLRDDELVALAALGSTVIVNTSSNMRLCSGIPPLAALHDCGVAFGAGLDGLALGDLGDYWQELRMLRGVLQAQTGRVADADMLFERLYSSGVTALGRCAPTRPEPGALADFLLVNVDGYRHLLQPGRWSAAEVAIAVGTPARTVEVWVAGECVKSGSRS